MVSFTPFFDLAPVIGSLERRDYVSVGPDKDKHGQIVVSDHDREMILQSPHRPLIEQYRRHGSSKR